MKSPVQYRALSFQDCSLSLSLSLTHTHTHARTHTHTLSRGARCCRSVILSASLGLSCSARSSCLLQVSESPQTSLNSPQQQLEITERRCVCVCVCCAQVCLSGVCVSVCVNADMSFCCKQSIGGATR